MGSLENIIPDNYRSILDVRETEKAIKYIKDFFEQNLAETLNLHRATAPLFVPAFSGINDDLNGIEKPVSFQVKDMDDMTMEVVQSLAKWKRLTLANLMIYPGEGIYTDMNAIRPDECLDNLHSIYVDQWDWERTILEENRQLTFLKKIVHKIYRVLRRTEWFIHEKYPEIGHFLPEEITFIHSEELEEKYPDLSPIEREEQAAKKYGALFLIGIGAPLKNGKPHEGRAPDYDDWISPNDRGTGLNGDIIFWNPVLNRAFEISSMGIRVSPESLLRQLEMCDQTERKQLYYHQRLLKGELPLSIGGGIGQSRLCMFYLRKAHIGEIQASVWPDEMHLTCRKNGVFLL
ncbi:aspartate--ammonia ligase [candidate division CSSED10-310 bacterium]|uniref:Aspartate--ammonia ligase n=1 Tax=candidate division CSSED10-310 bacterium TaxID=2855610 RepID=A0ABV6YRP8_UNCC1